MAFENSGTLLDVQLNDTTLVVRIDEYCEGDELLRTNPLIVLTLKNCREVEEPLSWLRKQIGRFIVWNVYKTEESVRVNFDDDFGDETSIECLSIDEEHGNYSTNDWRIKFERLSNSYKYLSDEHYDLSAKYNNLTRKLKTEITKELDHCQRKIEFFKTTHPEKVEAIKAVEKAYQKILNLMSQVIDKQK